MCTSEVQSSMTVHSLAYTSSPLAGDFSLLDEHQRNSRVREEGNEGDGLCSGVSSTPINQKQQTRSFHDAIIRDR